MQEDLTQRYALSIAVKEAADARALSEMILNDSRLRIASICKTGTQAIEDLMSYRPQAILLEAALVQGAVEAPFRAAIKRTGAVPVVLRGRPPGAAQASNLARLSNANGLANRIVETIMKSTAGVPTSEPARASSFQASKVKAILMGASTGGLDALAQVLASFPPDCPPTAIVQHTGDMHRESLVALLNKHTSAQVVRAEDGAALRPGTIAVATRKGQHLTLEKPSGYITRLRSARDLSGHVPSVDALFKSAEPFASQVVGVIMTGMGDDGANGLLTLREAGARTVGQNEESSTVYGMPKRAFELGAVEVQVGLEAIASAALDAAGYKDRRAKSA